MHGTQRRSIRARGGRRRTGAARQAGAAFAARADGRRAADHRRAYSPIVIAGFVRIFEFVMIALVGIAVVLRLRLSAIRAGLRPLLCAATSFAVAALGVLAFQVADIYHIHAFRRPGSQLAKLTVAWSLVFLLARPADVLRAARRPLTRASGSPATIGAGLLALYAFRLVLYGNVRRWSREGRLDRRAVWSAAASPARR